MTTRPAADMLADYRAAGGTGKAYGAVKACWGEDEDAARKLAHEIWPTSGVPGQLHQDLPTPTHFEQAASNVTVEQATEGTPCGPDPEPYVEAFRPFAEAGFDERRHLVAQVDLKLLDVRRVGEGALRKDVPLRLTFAGGGVDEARLRATDVTVDALRVTAAGEPGRLVNIAALLPSALT